MADDGGDRPAQKIHTGDIREATFTVNKYVIEDGEVVEEEVDYQLGDEELDELREEIDASVEEAMTTMETTGTPPTGFDLAEPTKDDVDVPESAEPEPEEDEEEAERPDVLEEIARQISGDAEPEDRPVISGRVIAEFHDIDKHQWPTFAKHMRERNISDQETISEVWAQLREEGVIGDPPEEPEQDEEPDEEGTEEADEEADAVERVFEDMPGEVVGDASDYEDGDEYLLFREGSDPSNVLLAALDDAVTGMEFIGIPIESAAGRDLLAELEGDFESPIYLRVEGDEFVEYPIAALTSKYLGE